MEQTQRQTHLFDAQGKVLGRLATEIATVLSGRDRVDFAPHKDEGAAVVVINAAKIKVTGNKESDKMYYHYSGYPGGIKDENLGDVRKRDARLIVERAVKGMLPKNKLAARMMARLEIHNDDAHESAIDVTHE